MSKPWASLTCSTSQASPLNESTLQIYWNSRTFILQISPMLKYPNWNGASDRNWTSLLFPTTKTMQVGIATNLGATVLNRMSTFQVIRSRVSPVGIIRHQRRVINLKVVLATFWRSLWWRGNAFLGSRQRTLLLSKEEPILRSLQKLGKDLNLRIFYRKCLKQAPFWWCFQVWRRNNLN